MSKDGVPLRSVVPSATERIGRPRSATLPGSAVRAALIIGSRGLWLQRRLRLLVSKDVAPEDATEHHQGHRLRRWHWPASGRGGPSGSSRAV